MAMTSLFCVCVPVHVVITFNKLYIHKYFRNYVRLFTHDKGINYELVMFFLVLEGLLCVCLSRS